MYLMYKISRSLTILLFLKVEMEMMRKWWNVRSTIIILALLVIGVGIVLLQEEVPYYSKKYHWTKYSLRLARMDINRFKQVTGRYPNSLNEISEYAKEHGDLGFYGKRYGEFLTDTEGNQIESQILNGQGGLFYNKENGEVKVNITKPVKNYLHLYFGTERNEVPSDW